MQNCQYELVDKEHYKQCMHMGKKQKEDENKPSSRNNKEDYMVSPKKIPM